MREKVKIGALGSPDHNTYQVDHLNIHLFFSTIGELILKIDFIIQCPSILASGLHASVWVLSLSASSIFAIVAIIWVNVQIT